MSEPDANLPKHWEPYRDFEIHVSGAAEMLFSHPQGFPPVADLEIIIDEASATLSDVVGFPPNAEGATRKLEEMENDEAVIDLICSNITASIRHALTRNRQRTDVRP